MELISKLQDSKAKTLEHAQSSEADLLKTYGEGKWNIRQILVHLSDAETVLYGRVRRAICEERPVVWGFDQDAWVDVMTEGRNLDLAMKVYAATRDANIELVEHFYVSHGERVLVHSYDGVKKVADVMEKILWHNERHLGQIAQALS